MMTAGLPGRGPKYLRIADVLRDEIRAGELGDDRRLPAETALVERFGVSLPTLRQAIGVLRSEGLVESRHGIGTFVKDTRRRQRHSRIRYGRAHEDEQPEASDLERQIVSAGREPAPSYVAEAMSAEPGADVVVRRVHLYDRDSGQLEEIGASYLPVEIAGGTYLEEPDPAPKALFLCVEELGGQRYAIARDRWVSRFPSPEEADLFGLTGGMHVLQVTHTACAADGSVLEVSESIWPADRMTFVDEYDIETGA